MSTHLPRPIRNPVFAGIQQRPKGQLRPEDVERRSAEFEEICEYFHRRQSALDVVATTCTRSGQVLDWVRPESQFGFTQLPLIPHFNFPNRGASKHRPPLFEIEVQPDAWGPKGTVPILRTQPERLLPKGSLSDFLSKHGRALRLNAERKIYERYTATNHLYAGTEQNVRHYACAGQMEVWKPAVEWSDEFSLGQMAISRGENTGLQTIETGFHVYHQKYGDWDPHWFVYYTTNGYTRAGDNLGGYNQDVAGWVQVHERIFPGARFLSWSGEDGTRRYFDPSVMLYNGLWMISMDFELFGYYPASLFGANGLLSEAARMTWFGEVIDSDLHEGITKTDMGSGRLPSSGDGNAAKMGGIAYVTKPVSEADVSDVVAYSPTALPSDVGYEVTLDGDGFSYGGPGVG